jgi:hypothetical protein
LGDLSTHKAVFTNVVRPLLMERLRLTGSQAFCFELGNWLRDVSQFRDPYSFQVQKLLIYQDKKPGIFANPAKRLLDQIFGPNYMYDKGPVVSGAFGEWFRQILTAFGIVSFRSADLPLNDQISESDFQRLFTAYFTEYFPHEHLDFAPTGDAKLLGDWSKSSEHTQGPGGERRKILGYLDDFVDYIATQFLRAEIDLKWLMSHRPNEKTNESQRSYWNATLQEGLVKLGKASHALEDYFYHSNFTELAFLHTALGTQGENIGLRPFYSVRGVGLLPETHKRRLFRRIRAPLLDRDSGGNSVLSSSDSQYAQFVFTGMFGQDDALYTFSDAFESIESLGFSTIFVNKLGSTLFKYVLDPQARRTLVKTTGPTVVTDEAAIKRANTQHIQELKAQKLVKQAAMVGAVSPLFAASIKRANEIDLGITIEAEGLVLDDAAIGFVLLTLAARVEAANQNSLRTAQAMDKEPKDIQYLASNNTNGEENVGSHTLMAKDSVRKLPLRVEADTFARYAVKLAMSTLTAQVTEKKDANKHVNWGEFLRRLICHPAQAPGNWAKKILMNTPVPPKTFEPTWLSQPEATKVLEDGLKRTALMELSYRDLYAKAAAAWSKAVE